MDVCTPLGDTLELQAHVRIHLQHDGMMGEITLMIS